jgi:proteasome lid subunit RPN8/RPN11
MSAAVARHSMFCLLRRLPLSGRDMYLLRSDEVQQLLRLVRAALPREASGLLLRQEFKPFTLLSVAATPVQQNTPLSFRISDAAIDTIAKSLRESDASIGGVFHSHPQGPAKPSRRDSLPPKELGSLWLIYSVRFRDLNLFKWDGTGFQKERFLVAPRLDSLPARCACGQKGSSDQANAPCKCKRRRSAMSQFARW